MSVNFPPSVDEWLLEQAPQTDVVVSSRARLARNLPGYPFSPRANRDQLAAIAQTVREAVSRIASFSDYHFYDLSGLTGLDRKFLKESHLISAELEKGREHRCVYLSEVAQTSIMINEEDHLRMQTLLAGLRVSEVYRNMDAIETELERVLDFAYSSEFGYLTACPTNVGTGLRLSVMLHLVGLVMTSQVEDALSALPSLGLVVRGAYGEHSTHTGDLFQISNEVTLGKTEEALLGVLSQAIGQVIERERQARALLFEHAAAKCEDAIERAVGVLTHARSMESSEALALLSRIRLGLTRDFGIPFTHEQLSRLIIDVQPAHLRRSLGEFASAEEGDMARAALLRAKFRNGRSANN